LTMVDGAPLGRPTGFLGASSNSGDFWLPAWRGTAAISDSSTDLNADLDGSMIRRKHIFVV
jgi:hypothetical protein